MDFARMIKPVLLYGVLVAVGFGLLNVILDFGLNTIRNLAGATAIAEIQVIVSVLMQGSAGLLFIVPFVLGWFVAKRIGVPDLASAAISGALAVVVMNIVLIIIVMILLSFSSSLFFGRFLVSPMFGPIVLAEKFVIGIAQGAIGGAIYSIMAKKSEPLGK